MEKCPFFWESKLARNDTETMQLRFQPHPRLDCHFHFREGSIDFVHRDFLADRNAGCRVETGERFRQLASIREDGVNKFAHLVTPYEKAALGGVVEITILVWITARPD
jgi:hypothetical protein